MDHISTAPAPFRWPPVVFCLPLYEPLRVGALEATRRPKLRLPAILGSRRVAYATQFLDPTNRAHYGQSRIKNRLIANLDPDEWSLPPKPKWIRWKTYNRYVDKFDRYEAILDEGTLELLAKFMGRA